LGFVTAPANKREDSPDLFADEDNNEDNGDKKKEDDNDEEEEEEEAEPMLTALNEHNFIPKIVQQSVADNEEDEDSNEDEDNPEKKMESEGSEGGRSDNEGSEGGRSDNEGGEEEDRSDSEGGEEEEALTQKKHQDEADEYDNYFGDHAAGDRSSLIPSLGEFLQVKKEFSNKSRRINQQLSQQPSIEAEEVMEVEQPSDSRLDTDEENRLKKTVVSSNNILVLLQDHNLLGRNASKAVSAGKQKTQAQQQRAAQKAKNQERKDDLARRMDEAAKEKPALPEQPSPSTTKHHQQLHSTPTRGTGLMQPPTTPVTPRTAASYSKRNSSLSVASSITVAANDSINTIDVSSHREGIGRYLLNRESMTAAGELIKDVDFRNAVETIRDGSEDDKFKLMAAVALAAMDVSQRAVAGVSKND
jgi:hypothetical protein